MPAPRTKEITVANVTAPVNQDHTGPVGRCGSGESGLVGLDAGLTGLDAGLTGLGPGLGRQPGPAVVTGQLARPRRFGAAAGAGHDRGVDRRLGGPAHSLRVAPL